MTAGIDSDLQAFLALPNSTSTTTAKTAAAKVARDETRLTAALRKASWPGAVQPDITNLARTAAAEQRVYAQCAAAHSVTAIKAVLAAHKATIAARVAAAAHVRAALGLPATPTAPAQPSTTRPA